MQIKVNAKIILTIPQSKETDFVEDIVLAAEQFINKLQGFNMSTTGTVVGVRAHINSEGMKVTK